MARFSSRKFIICLLGLVFCYYGFTNELFKLIGFFGCISGYLLTNEAGLKIIEKLVELIKK